MMSDVWKIFWIVCVLNVYAAQDEINTTETNTTYWQVFKNTVSRMSQYVQRNLLDQPHLDESHNFCGGGVPACWQLPPAVLDLLITPAWRDCPYLFYTQQGLRWLWEQTQKRLEEHGKTAPQMMEALKGTFEHYLEKYPAPEGSWLHGIEDLREVASSFFPGDMEAQAYSVIHMMLYYTKCRESDAFGMFDRNEKPTPGDRKFNMCGDLTELFGREYVAVGTRILYLFQKDYTFSLLDFFVALRKKQALAVVPMDWEAKWSAHDGDFEGMFELLVRHDFVHGMNVGIFLSVMQIIDSDFEDNCNTVVERVFSRRWQKKGPSILTGGFFLLHEILGPIIDVDAQLLFAEDMPLMKKVEQILAAGAKRYILDKGFYPLVRSLHPGHKDSFNATTALYKMTRSFAQEFMVDYRRLPVQPTLHPFLVVMKEWLHTYKSLDAYIEIVQKVCDYACDQDPNVERVTFVQTSYCYQIVPNTIEGVYIGKTKVGLGDVPFLEFIPTQKVVDSYDTLRKQHMVQEYKTDNILDLTEDFPAQMSKLHMLTQDLLQKLSQKAKEEIFGKRNGYDDLWEKGAFISLWDQEKQKMIGVCDMAQRVMDKLVKYIPEHARQWITECAEMLKVKCGGGLGRMVMVVLGDLYIHAKETGSSISDIERVLEGIEPPTYEILEACTWKGRPLIAQLREWSYSVRDYGFVLVQPSLLQSVAAEATGKRMVVVLGDKEEGYVPIYDQWECIHERVCCEGTWKLHSSNHIHAVRYSLLHSLLKHWEHIGIYYMMGARLLFDSITSKKPSVEPLLTSAKALDRLLLEVEEAQVKENLVLEEISLLIDDKALVYSPAQRMMYVAGLMPFLVSRGAMRSITRQ